MKQLTSQNNRRKVVPMMVVTLRAMPETLWRQFKAQAAKEGVPVYQLYTRVLADYVQKHAE